jgi:hypothetical protein
VNGRRAGRVQLDFRSFEPSAIAMINLSWRARLTILSAVDATLEEEGNP